MTVQNWVDFLQTLTTIILIFWVGCLRSSIKISDSPLSDQMASIDKEVASSLYGHAPRPCSTRYVLSETSRGVTPLAEESDPAPQVLTISHRIESEAHLIPASFESSKADTNTQKIVAELLVLQHTCPSGDDQGQA